MVTRDHITYSIRTAKIGKGRPRKRAKTRAELREGLSQLKKRESGNARCLFAAIEKWALGPSSAEECPATVQCVLRNR